MPLSRGGWRVTRLQCALACLPVLAITPWCMVNGVVGGHANFQPLGSALGLAGMRAYQTDNQNLARKLLRSALRFHTGDLRRDAGYAYFAHWYAGLLYGEEKFGEALLLEQEAASINARVFGESSRQALMAKVSAADNMVSLGRYLDAEVCAKEALLLERQPGTTAGNLVISRTQHILCDIYVDTGRLAEAKQALDGCLEIERRELGLKSGWTFQSLSNEAAIQANSGYYSDAEKKYEELLLLEEKVMDSDDRWQENTRVNIALMREKQHKTSTETQKICNDGIARCNLKSEQERTNFYGYARSVAALCAEQGKLAEAERLYDMALKLALKADGPEYPGTVIIKHKLAALYLKQGRLTKAEALAVEVRNVRINTLGSDNLYTAATSDLLGQIKAAQGNQLEAERLFVEALLERGSKLGAGNSLTMESWHHLCNVRGQKFRTVDYQMDYASCYNYIRIMLKKPDENQALAEIQCELPIYEWPIIEAPHK